MEKMEDGWMEKMDGWREVKLLDGTEGRLAGRKLNFTWKICNIKHKFQPLGLLRYTNFSI